MGSAVSVCGSIMLYIATWESKGCSFLPAVVERLCFLSDYSNKKLTVSCPLFLGILCSCWTYDAHACWLLCFCVCICSLPCFYDCHGSQTVAPLRFAEKETKATPTDIGDSLYLVHLARAIQGQK
eukprot:05828_6